MKNQEVYLHAKKKVEARMSFYTHLLVYLVIITVVTILNLTVAGEYFWAKWPMIGWGSGVIFHGLSTFVFDSEPSLKERLIEKEIQKFIDQDPDFKQTVSLLKTIPGVALLLSANLLVVTNGFSQEIIRYTILEIRKR